MPSSREVWASAFAAQSRSDWQVYDRLTAELTSAGGRTLLKLVSKAIKEF
jgi:hypothetical protein